MSDSILLLSTLLVYSFPAVYAFLDKLDQIASACEYIKTFAWPVCMMAHTMTIYLTVLVTFNRYCAICRPIQDYRSQSPKAVGRMVFFTLLFSILYNFPRFFEHHTISRVVVSQNSSNLSTGEPPVLVNLGDSLTYQIIYSNIVYYPVMYILPLSCLTYLNAKLIQSLKALGRKKACLTGGQATRIRSDNDHITLCVVVIVCVFIFCQTPALVNQIFWAALSNEQRQCGQFHFYYTKVSDVLVVLNSSCNIVIYCLCGRRFRNIFLNTLCCCGVICFNTDTGGQSEQTDIMLRQLDLRANNNEPSDNEDSRQENGTIEQAVSHV